MDALETAIKWNKDTYRATATGYHMVDNTVVHLHNGETELIEVVVSETGECTERPATVCDKCDYERKEGEGRSPFQRGLVLLAFVLIVNPFLTVPIGSFLFIIGPPLLKLFMSVMIGFSLFINMGLFRAMENIRKKSFFSELKVQRITSNSSLLYYLFPFLAIRGWKVYDVMFQGSYKVFVCFSKGKPTRYAQLTLQDMYLGE